MKKRNFEIKISGYAQWLSSDCFEIIAESEYHMYVVLVNQPAKPVAPQQYPTPPAPVHTVTETVEQQGVKATTNVYKVSKTDSTAYRNCYEMFVVVNDKEKTILRSDFKSMEEAQSFIDENELHDHCYPDRKLIAL